MKYWGKKEEEPLRITILGFLGAIVAILAFSLSDWIYYFAASVPDPETGRIYEFVERGGAKHYIWPWLAHVYHFGSIGGLAVLFLDAVLGYFGVWPDNWVIDFEKIESRLPVASAGDRWKSILLAVLFFGLVVTVAGFGILHPDPKKDMWFEIGGVLVTGFLFLTPVFRSKVKFRIGAFLAGLCLVASMGGLKLLLDDRSVQLWSPIILVFGILLFIFELRALLRDAQATAPLKPA